MSQKERAIIENYILANIAIETEYYEKSPASFQYAGEDEKLQRDLKLLKLKKMLQALAVKEDRAKKEVDFLVNNSLKNYYFDRIGDTLLLMRKQLKDSKEINLITIEKTKNEIKELVKAYNVYSENKITLDRAVPSDLKKLFEYN
jgi:hypothetical protein